MLHQALQDELRGQDISLDLSFPICKVQEQKFWEVLPSHFVTLCNSDDLISQCPSTHWQSMVPFFVIIPISAPTVLSNIYNVIRERVDIFYTILSRVHGISYFIRETEIVLKNHFSNPVLTSTACSTILPIGDEVCHPCFCPHEQGH